MQLRILRRVQLLPQHLVRQPKIILHHRARFQAAPDGSRRVNFDFPPVNKDRAHDCVDEMRKIGDAKGVSVARIALAWLLHQKAVSSVIVGAKTVEQLNDNLAATEVELSAEELARLDEVSKLPDEYPGWMIDRQNANRAS